MFSLRPVRLICFAAASAALLGTLCSCGHNAVVFGKGFGFRAGLDPEHLSADFSVIYGEQLTLAARDNLEIDLKTDVTGGSESAAASTAADSILRIRIGRQVNGYACDLIQAGASPDHLRALLSPELEPSPKQD